MFGKVPVGYEVKEVIMLRLGARSQTCVSERESVKDSYSPHYLIDSNARITCCGHSTSGPLNHP